MNMVRFCFIICEIPGRSKAGDDSVAWDWNHMKASLPTLLWLSLESIIYDKHHVIMNIFLYITVTFDTLKLLQKFVFITTLKLWQLLDPQLDLVIWWISKEAHIYHKVLKILWFLYFNVSFVIIYFLFNALKTFWEKFLSQ